LLAEEKGFELAMALAMRSPSNLEGSWGEYTGGPWKTLFVTNGRHRSFIKLRCVLVVFNKRIA